MLKMIKVLLGTGKKDCCAVQITDIKNEENSQNHSCCMDHKTKKRFRERMKEI